MSFIKFIPCLPADEEGEKRDTEAHHESAHGREQRTEAEAALEVDTEGNENAVGYECTMNPAESHGKGEREPRHGTEKGAVENPFGHLEAVAREKQAAVKQHDQRTDWRDDADNETGEPPEP